MTTPKTKTTQITKILQNIGLPLLTAAIGAEYQHIVHGATYLKDKIVDVLGFNTNTESSVITSTDSQTTKYIPTYTNETISHQAQGSSNTYNKHTPIEVQSSHEGQKYSNDNVINYQSSVTKTTYIPKKDIVDQMNQSLNNMYQKTQSMQPIDIKDIKSIDHLRTLIHIPEHINKQLTHYILEVHDFSDRATTFSPVKEFGVQFNISSKLQANEIQKILEYSRDDNLKANFELARDIANIVQGEWYYLSQRISKVMNVTNIFNQSEIYNVFKEVEIATAQYAQDMKMHGRFAKETQKDAAILKDKIANASIVFCEYIQDLRNDINDLIFSTQDNDINSFQLRYEDLIEMAL